MVFGKHVDSNKVKTLGISSITSDDVLYAEKLDCVIKLVGQAEKTDEKVYASVEPMLIKKGTPLYGIDDVFNGIAVNGNAIGDVMFYGRGAGKLPTASAVVSDIIEIATYLSHPIHTTQVWERLTDDEILSADRLKSRWYLRFDKKPSHCLASLGAEVLEDSEDCYAVVTDEVTLLDVGITVSEKFTAMRVL